MDPSVTIRFIAGNDWISRAIRTETWSAFNHVEFVLDDGRMLGAHADIGVQILAANYCTPTNEERYRIPCTQEQKDAILDFAIFQVGKRYDYGDILGILFHRDWRDAGRWICSELVTAAFEVGKRPLLHAPLNIVNRITPQHVYMSPELIGRRIWPVDESLTTQSIAA